MLKEFPAPVVERHWDLFMKGRLGCNPPPPKEPVTLCQTHLATAVWLQPTPCDCVFKNTVTIFKMELAPAKSIQIHQSLALDSTSKM